MQQIKLGEITVDQVTEIPLQWIDAKYFFPNITDEIIAKQRGPLGPLFMHPDEDKVGLSFHGFLVRTHGKNIIVDTCNGNHKTRLPAQPWQHMLDRPDYLENLAALGVRPEDIDIVVTTHLHTDHLGWNTTLVDGQWKPTFPNARYLIVRDEFGHNKRLHDTNPPKPVLRGTFADSVLPVVDAGLVDFVDVDHVVVGEVGNGIWLESTIGHTRGHVIVHVADAEGEVVITGDLLVHPLHIVEPALVNPGDWDPDIARATRERIFARYADTTTTLLPIHFPSPTGVRITRVENGFDFHFAETEQPEVALSTPA